MSKITVQAMDSAAAMDEIVSKLGPDAVILSTTKLNGKVVMEAASGTVPNPILNKDEFIGFIIGNPDPKKLIMKLIRYKTPIPAVAANTPNLKFSVGAIIFVLYANNNAMKIANVRKIACPTIPSNC